MNKILDSKIQIPRCLRYHVERLGLLKKLNESEEKVVMINAGAGYGKTVLLSDYASVSKSSECAWYHVDSTDDFFTFVEYLSCSINRIIPEFEFNIVFSEDKEVTPSSVAYDFAVAVMNCLDGRITVVIDDFQENRDEETEEFLSVLINNTSDNFRLFIASKGAFPIFLTRFLYEEKVLCLTSENMAFSSEEISELIGDIENLDEIDDINKSVEIISKYTEGWPAGVMAIALQIKQERKKIKPAYVEALSKECPVKDYLMYEILRKQPYDIQTFLLQSSVLDILSASICNSVLGITNAKSTLDYLMKENLFVTKLGYEDDVYRYHSLFKDYLSNKLNPNQKMDIYKKACKVCINKGFDEQALSYAIKAQDFSLVKIVIEVFGEKLISAHKYSYFERMEGYMIEHIGEWNLEVCLVYLELYLFQKRKEDYDRLIDLTRELVEKSESAKEIERFERIISQDKALPAKEKETKEGKLYVKCLGEFEVLTSDGKPIKWRTKKVKELFAFLFDMAGKPASKEQIASSLWDEEENANIYSLFYTTVSYLRKTLAENDMGDLIIQKNRMYYFDMSVIESNIDEFEALFDSIQTNRPEGNIKLVNEVYKGVYLGDMQGEWLLNKREHYERNYFKLIEIQSEHLIKNKKIDDAIELLVSAVEIDSYDEKFASMLIRCYGLKGDVRSAKRQFERTSNILLEELGVDPGEELVKSYYQAMEVK